MIDIEEFLKTHLNEAASDLDEINAMISKYSEIVSKERLEEGVRAQIRLVNGKIMRIWKLLFLKFDEYRNFNEAISILLFGVFKLDIFNEDDQKNLLYELHDYQVESNYFDLLLWLRAIAQKNIMPCIDDLGSSYVDFTIKNSRGTIKNTEEAMKRYRKESSEVLVDWEFKQIEGILRKMCYFNRSNIYLAHPSALRRTVEESYLGSSKIQRVLEKIESIDFGLFYRETLVAIDGRTLKLNIRVLPHFIFLPVAADSFVMHQSISDRDLHKRGRIFVPIYYNGANLEKDLIFVLGEYRWDVLKSVSGHLWRDPVDGGLSGRFYDLFDNYEKIIKDEERIPEFEELKIRYQKSIGRVFASLYIDWVLKEAENVLTLYKEVREMFWQFIPMSKSYRNRLQNHNQHASFVQRTNNVRREKLRLEKMALGKIKTKTEKERKMIESNMDYWRN